jgi:hypothetical protein
LEDDWVIETVARDFVELVHAETAVVATLGRDHIYSYFTNRSGTGSPSGLLQLHSQVWLEPDGRVSAEPLLTPRLRDSNNESLQREEQKVTNQETFLSKWFPRVTRQLDKLEGWRKTVAERVISGLILAALLGASTLAGKWVYDQLKTTGDQTIQRTSVKVSKVLVVPMGVSGAPWPLLNVYYTIAGPVPVSGLVSHWAAGFATGQLTAEKIEAEQDALLRWDGWDAAMTARRQFEISPGETHFTTIPHTEGDHAKLFRENFDKVAAGTSVLYVFIAFKHSDNQMPANARGVAEDCFWFSGGNFARHTCGRRRSFLERRP